MLILKQTQTFASIAQPTLILNRTSGSELNSVLVKPLKMSAAVIKQVSDAVV